MVTKNTAALNTLRERAQKIIPVDAGHDFAHLERVAKDAKRIYSEELLSREGRKPALEELEACEVAALLHDCVPIAKNSPLRKESSRLASEKAREWLKELSWTPITQVDDIAGAILDHSYSSGRVPSTLLGEALQDADRLESLGAIGLYRTIATGVSMGADFFCGEDPWARHRELDDKKYSLDHFFTKLFKLHVTFRTAAARAEAEKRTEFLREFVEQLRLEL